MNRRTFLNGALAGAGALIFSKMSHAHRVNSVLTTVKLELSEPGHIEWNITHQVHFHDALKVLHTISGDSSLTLLDIKPRAQLLLHMAEEFKLFTGEGQPIDLIPVGAEVEGDYAFFYQTSHVIETHDALTVDNQLFVDLFDGQLNTVNIDAYGTIQTIAFLKNTKPKRVII